MTDWAKDTKRRCANLQVKQQKERISLRIVTYVIGQNCTKIVGLARVTLHPHFEETLTGLQVFEKHKVFLRREMLRFCILDDIMASHLLQ